MNEPKKDSATFSQRLEQFARENQLQGPFDATLAQDGLPQSTGIIWISANRQTGTFEPTDGKLPAIDLRREMRLKILGSDFEIHTKKAEPCETGAHFHFWA